MRGQGEDALLELVTSGNQVRAGSIRYRLQARRQTHPYAGAARSFGRDASEGVSHADFDAYERGCGKRWAMYTSSLACLFNCAYCTNAGVYGRKWNALPPEQFVEETVDLTRRYRLKCSGWWTTTFSSISIAHAASRKGWCAKVQFKWSIQATTNMVAGCRKISPLRRAGCTGLPGRRFRIAEDSG